MSNKIQLKLEELNRLSPAKIVENEKVEQKFIQMYNAIHGTGIGVQVYTKEKFNFQKVLQEKPELSECSKLSLFGCFLDMAVNGLSLDPTGKPHCYLIPRNVKTGYKDENGRPVYEKRAGLSVTGYGELVMRMRAGQIKYADNPVVVYEGDVFKAELISGKKVVTYSATIPRKSTNVVGCFIRIVRIDGSEDYQWMLEGDIQRLAGFSAKNNSYWKDGKLIEGKANALYSSNSGGIDPGFLENKMIKHAFDAYPKVRTGNYTIMETMEEPRNEIDYGIEDTDAEDLTQKQTGFGEENTPTIQLQTETVVSVTQEDDDAGF